MSWIEIGKTPHAKQAIHYLGGDIQKYNESGILDASPIQKLIPAPFKVMEYGCGTGRILQHIKDCHKVGVDIVPEFVSECKKNGIEAHLIKDYDFKGDCDIIYAITVFIHLSKKDGLEALENVWRGLKEGGLALLQIPIYKSNKEPSKWYDVGVWTEELLRETCEKVGFEVVTLYTNPDDFSFDKVGVNHDKAQVLRKKIKV